jgi:hypothetical protein
MSTIAFKIVQKTNVQTVRAFCIKSIICYISLDNPHLFTELNFEE